MTKETFAQSLAVRVLAGEGIAAIWELHVAAAAACRRGQTDVALLLIEIADAAERHWLAANSTSEPLAPAAPFNIPL